MMPMDHSIHTPTPKNGRAKSVTKILPFMRPHHAPITGSAVKLAADVGDCRETGQKKRLAYKALRPTPAA
jgi:hypothetical protein